ncbi:MAG: ribulose-phosphate 3-epimerase [Lachnospiraceae bacterium]|nr:ribulose-phosphate 3-epimerase [Lachnospiraceae bacterium]
MMKLAASVLSADFTKLGEQVKLVDQAGVDYIHIDVIDGKFAPNITFGMPVIEAIRKVTDKPLDVHLMIEEPIRYLQEFKEAGADIVTVHAEACTHLHRTITKIRELDMKAGVALNPASSVSILNYIFDDIDLALIMSVNPGFSGQTFIPAVLDKIKRIHKIAEDKGLVNLDIEVDGGITLSNISSVIDAGANVIVSGASIFRGEPDKNVKEFLKKMK